MLYFYQYKRNFSLKVIFTIFIPRTMVKSKYLDVYDYLVKFQGLPIEGLFKNFKINGGQGEKPCLFVFTTQMRRFRNG